MHPDRCATPYNHDLALARATTLLLLCESHISTQIEYDADKDEINRFKHRLPLAFGRRVFGDPFLTLSPTIRVGDEEERWKAVGYVDGKLYTAVHVWRGNVVRMISVRRSNANERRDYDRDSGRSE